jgi:hypothetical protein
MTTAQLPECLDYRLRLEIFGNAGQALVVKVSVSLADRREAVTELGPHSRITAATLPPLLRCNRGPESIEIPVRRLLERAGGLADKISSRTVGKDTERSAFGQQTPEVLPYPKIKMRFGDSAIMLG